LRIIARQARLPSVNIRRFIVELACVALRSPPVVHACYASDHESPKLLTRSMMQACFS
jgi:hypothetical protein